MIKINLLPRKRVRAKPRSGSELWIGIFAIIAVLVVIYLTHTNQVAKIENTQAKIKTTQDKIDGLKDVEQKIEDFKKKNEELKKRIQLIADLEKKTSGPLLVVDALSSSIPERAWITEFASRGENAKIQGIAWNEFTVADFLKSLEESKQFDDVEIKSIEKEEINNLIVREFEISSKLNFLMIEEKSESDGKK